MEQSPSRKVANVWIDGGDNPARHAFLQAKLAYKWPELAKALDALVEHHIENPEEGDGPGLPAWWPEGFDGTFWHRGNAADREQFAEDFAEQVRRRHRTTAGWDGIVRVPTDLRSWVAGVTCGATANIPIPGARLGECGTTTCNEPAGHEGFHEDILGNTWFRRPSAPKPADDQADAAARELADQIRHNHATPDTAEVLANQTTCVSQFEATTHRTEPNTIHCRLKAGHDGKHEGRGHEAGALRRWDDETTGPSMRPSGVGRTVQEALHAVKPTGTIFDDGRPLPCGAPGKFSPDTCILTMGHAGNHEDASGCDWQQETCDEPYPGDPKGRACSRWKGHPDGHHTREGWAWK